MAKSLSDQAHPGLLDAESTEPEEGEPEERALWVRILPSYRRPVHWAVSAAGLLLVMLLIPL